MKKIDFNEIRKKCPWVEVNPYYIRRLDSSEYICVAAGGYTECSKEKCAILYWIRKMNED